MTQRFNRHRLLTTITCGLIGMSLCSCAWSADVAAGKVIAQAKCAACHEPADWKGETAASLQSLILDVISGKVKHSKTKVELSDTELADVAAYWLTGKK